MKRANERGEPPGLWMMTLYALAGPAFVVRGALYLLRFLRLRRLARSGCLECPHCGAANPLDVLAVCPKCQTAEYGIRLRCSGCGTRAMAFPCDECHVTIRVL